MKSKTKIIINHKLKFIKIQFKIKFKLESELFFKLKLKLKLNS